MNETLHVNAIGNLTPEDIGGEHCEGCRFNTGNTPMVLLTGTESAVASASRFMFGDIELMPVGTTERIKELEERVKQYGKAGMI